MSWVLNRIYGKARSTKETACRWADGGPPDVSSHMQRSFCVAVFWAIHLQRESTDFLSEHDLWKMEGTDLSNKSTDHATATKSRISQRRWWIMMDKLFLSHSSASTKPLGSFWLIICPNGPSRSLRSILRSVWSRWVPRFGPRSKKMELEEVHSNGWWVKIYKISWKYL